MSAVMVRLDFATGVVGVDVESVEMSTDILQRREVLLQHRSTKILLVHVTTLSYLSRCSAGRQSFVLGRQWLSWDVGVAT